MKKVVLTSILGIVVVGSANAGGFYINPKVAWTQTRIEESRDEQKAINGAWSTFAGAKSESWSDHKNQLTPRIAVGYDFDLDKYGVFGLGLEYTNASNHFNPTHGGNDFDGNIPNDSDMRDFKYTESTFALNATYGYKIGRVIPFVTAGIGYTTIDAENNFRSGTYWWETRDQEQNVSWNIGAGIEVPCTQNVSFTFAYQYTDLGNVKYTNRMYHENAKANNNGIERHFDSDVDLTRHDIMAGIKVSF